MTLLEMIEALKSLPPNFMVPLENPHSYRGYYDELAFEVGEPRPVQDVIADAENVYGKTFTGYKGGEYEYGDYTPVHVASYGSTGEELTQDFFDKIILQAELDNERVRKAACCEENEREVERLRAELAAEKQRANELAERVVELEGAKSEREDINDKYGQDGDTTSLPALRRWVRSFESRGLVLDDIMRAVSEGNSQWDFDPESVVELMDRADELEARVAEARRERDTALAQLAARDAEVPGLSPLPYYTPGDAKLIAEKKGKPYARLAVTADIADEALRWARLSKTSGTMESEDNAMRDWILALAATGNETKGVES
jgi:hypothetical protein